MCSHYHKTNPDKTIGTPVHAKRLLHHPEEVYFVIMTGWLYVLLHITWQLSKQMNMKLYYLSSMGSERFL